MVRLVCFLLALLGTTFRTRRSLQIEVAALRHQLLLYQASGKRPHITPADRLLWSIVARVWNEWRNALLFVQPRTVVRWQQRRFRDYWRRLSDSSRIGRPPISPELRALIAQMWTANPTWRTFLDSHLKDLVSVDFFIVPTVSFKVMFVFLVLSHRWRTHLSLDMDAPARRPVHSAQPAQVIEFPAVDGLHHYYLPKAA